MTSARQLRIIESTSTVSARCAGMERNMECEATQAYMPRISREPRELWVDCGKLLGNLLVVLLHTTDTLQWSDTVQNGSVVAVTLLLFLAGYTSYASAARYYARPDRGPVFYEILRRLKGVLPAYAVATFALLTGLCARRDEV